MLTSHPAAWSTAVATADTHLTSAAVVPPCRFCYRPDRRFRASGPLAFQQMQKIPLQRHPGKLRLSALQDGDVSRSAVRKTHGFHLLCSSPRTSHRLQDIASLQPPSSSSPLHLPFLPGLETCPVAHTTNN